MKKTRILAKHLRVIGPGVALAATGVGAGDLVAASVTGSTYGLAVVWAVLLGAYFKFVLNEGLARWQLATGTTLLEGWMQKLGKGVEVFFVGYLFLWSFVVGAALMAACGLAGHTLYPGLSVAAWGILHSVVGVVIALVGGYKGFEWAMKILVALMFVSFFWCALNIAPPIESLHALVTQASLPTGSAKYVLGVVGGVGGSLTLLVYGYWMKEQKWTRASDISLVRTDLSAAYILVGLFGAALMVVASATLFGQKVPDGNQVIPLMAGSLVPVLGKTGYSIFLWGFWGAVATSLFGVWQSVPYLFCDYWALRINASPKKRNEMIKTRSAYYRGYLIYLAVAPMVLLFVQKPILIILLYSVFGAIFMPFLAATLFYMNGQKKWMGNLRNTWVSQFNLLACIALFGWLSLEGFMEIYERFVGSR